MRILHVVAGLPRNGGGLAEIVPRYAAATARLGHDVTIATVAERNAPLSVAADEAAAAGVNIIRCPPSLPRALYHSREMSRRLPTLVARADLVHVHSNWTFPVWRAAHCALVAGKPLVMSPHGCLSPASLAHSAWKKRLAGLFDRRYLRLASVIHATSEMERDWIERYVGKGPRIAVIPNGVEMQAFPGTPRGLKPASRTRQVLYLGRLHPLKGLELLLDAWKGVGGTNNGRLEACPTGRHDRLEACTTGWELVIAGPDEQGTRAKLEAQARGLGLANVTFPGPLYGEEKAKALAEADLFVLPSRTENFGIAVAEALGAGLPVITTKGTPWSEIAGSCGWWVDVNAAAIAKALADGMRLSDEERAAMGTRGRELVAAKYQWESVGRAMAGVYERLVERLGAVAG
jgi:glycosyltransferase involved in cell wall biosynthesis